jgi:cytochrome bd-type quinol oxidase subunit 2
LNEFPPPPPVRPQPLQVRESEIDLNNDGLVSNAEEALYEKKAVNRRRMAWVSLIALIVSGICVMFVIPETRLKSLSGLLELYFISLAGIVGAYVGISTWMTKR